MTSSTKAPARADTVIRGGTVIDGTGAPGFSADVAIDGERIVAVGDLAATEGGREIDASGKTVSPGFIDVHTHDDYYLFTHPDMIPKASQGVTTVVVGNCGFSLSPWKRFDEGQFPFSLWLDRPELRFSTTAEYLDALDTNPCAVNSAALIGHSSLRYAAMNDLDRPANDAEISQMQSDLKESVEAGAVGMSSGLFYPPAQAASTEEVIAVCEAMAPLDGIYTAHIRNEDAHVIEAIEEAAEIGRRAAVQLLISHHKTAGLANHGRMRETLPLIERLRTGQRLNIDVYPYIAGSTMILPAMMKRASKVMITWSRDYPQHNGGDLDEIAAEMGKTREEAAEQLSPGGAIYFMLDEADVQKAMSHESAIIGSDGIPDDMHPHPRLWGTFPRVLGHYSRDLGLFPIEDAVRRMTGQAAAVFGFRDRGVIREGAFADITVFDANTIIDVASFDEPAQPAIGIDCVLVNGQPVWRDGGSTGERPGRPIRLSDTERGRTA
jgi:N-acyl-D-amino-acid deacylase